MINKFGYYELPEHVLQAMREEEQRFRSELRQFGPHVVTSDTYKPRLKAARERAEAEEAMRLHKQENPQDG